MGLSDQVDALQEQAAELKSSFERARHETSEQVKARIDQAKADIAAPAVSAAAPAPGSPVYRAHPHRAGPVAPPARRG
jgi:hypothetical protein